ncbi:hypothetical protein [Halopenitus persicus]|uniref:hypothetical protein n=1 Tax=Halopenitus persicus TaxID=1048396 RepID=UPI0012FD9258|nr:hypothetical protein [Halopenitus persicus]
MVKQSSSPHRPRDDVPSDNEEVAKLRLILNHKPLSALIEHGLVKIDKENEVVVKGPNFEEGRSLID